jgi:hypothetical protein
MVDVALLKIAKSVPLFLDVDGATKAPLLVSIFSSLHIVDVRHR